MAIRIIAGIIIHNDGTKAHTYTKADGELSFSPELEARYVAQGVAEYVTDEAETDAADAQTPVETIEDEGETNTDADTADDASPDPATAYDAMDEAALRAECKKRGITIKGKVSRAKLIAALEDDDKPPAVEAFGVE